MSRDIDSSSAKTQQKQNQLHESLSALIDNEATELELHRILSECEKDDALRARWQRYQMARSAMRKEFVSGSIDFADAVRTAIAGESSVQPSASTQSNASVKTSSSSAFAGWRANLGRAAIAASVAGMVLVGVQQMNNPASVGDAAPMVAEQSMEQPRSQQAILPVQAMVTTPNAQLASSSARTVSAPAASGALPPVNLQTVSQNFNNGLQYSRLPNNAMTYSPSPREQQLLDERVRLYIQLLMQQQAAAQQAYQQASQAAEQSQ